MLILSMPLDLVARRLGILRLRPISPKTYSQLLLWPAGGLALVALSWWDARHGGGWGALACAFSAAAFAQAYEVERTHTSLALPPWLVSRRNAILLLTLFSIGGAWTGFLIAVLIYAAISFFFVQYLVHRVPTELTPH
jgi:hypothetical protein